MTAQDVINIIEAYLQENMQTVKINDLPIANKVSGAYLAGVNTSNDNVKIAVDSIFETEVYDAKEYNEI